MKSNKNKELMKAKDTRFTLELSTSVALPFLFAQKIPYKEFVAIEKSKIHMTDKYIVNRFYKSICLI